MGAAATPKRADHARRLGHARHELGAIREVPAEGVFLQLLEAPR